MNFDEYKIRKQQMNEKVLKILVDDTKEGTLYTLHKRDRASGLNVDYGVFRNYKNLKMAMDACVEFEELANNENYYAADYEWFDITKYVMKDDEYERELSANLAFDYRLIHYIAEECVMKYHTLIEHELEPPYETGDIIITKNMPIAEDYYGVYLYDKNQKGNKHLVMAFNEKPSFFKTYWLETTERVNDSPNKRLNEISKKIKEMNGDFTKAFQEFGIQVELQPF